jgi:hypothetical protein
LGSPPPEAAAVEAAGAVVEAEAEVAEVEVVAEAGGLQASGSASAGRILIDSAR